MIDSYCVCVLKAGQGQCETVEQLLDTRSFNVTDTDMTGSPQIVNNTALSSPHSRPSDSGGPAA